MSPPSISLGHDKCDKSIQIYPSLCQMQMPVWQQRLRSQDSGLNEFSDTFICIRFFSGWTCFAISFHFFGFVHISKLENVLVWGAKTYAQSDVTFSGIGIFGICLQDWNFGRYKILLNLSTSIRLGVDWNWTRTHWPSRKADLNWSRSNIRNALRDLPAESSGEALCVSFVRILNARFRVQIPRSDSWEFIWFH